SRGSSRAPCSVGDTYTGIRRYTLGLPAWPASPHASRYGPRARFTSEVSVARRPTKMGSPARPAIGYVSSLVAAMRIGGCGTWKGRGATGGAAHPEDDA